jgi:hypothetical protein
MKEWMGMEERKDEDWGILFMKGVVLRQEQYAEGVCGRSMRT